MRSHTKLLLALVSGLLSALYPPGPAMAQAANPRRTPQAAATPAVERVTTQSIDRVTFELPFDWQIAPPALLGSTFRGRGDATLLAVYQREDGNAALPFALLERINYAPAGTTYSMIDTDTYIDRVRAYYESPVAIPLRPLNTGAWRHAKLSPLRWEPKTRSFRFHADIDFVDHPGSYHVEVVGLLAHDGVIVLSTWCDTATRPRYGETLHAMADSVRLTSLSDDVASLKNAAIASVKWVVGAIALLVIAVQIHVVLKERRHRREDIASVSQ